MRKPLLRSLPLVAALVVPLALSGCTSPEPAPTPTATDHAAPEGAGDRLDLTFAAGERLTQGQYVEWADWMLGHDDFEVAMPDAGDGLWGYTHRPSGCLVTFAQRTTEGLDGTDDRAMSDSALVAFARSDAQDLLAHAFDDAVWLQGEGLGTMDVRVISGGHPADGSSFTTAARAFGAIGIALVFDVSCSAAVTAHDVYNVFLEDQRLMAILS